MNLYGLVVVNNPIYPLSLSHYHFLHQVGPMGMSQNERHTRQNPTGMVDSCIVFFAYQGFRGFCLGLDIHSHIATATAADVVV